MKKLFAFIVLFLFFKYNILGQKRFLLNPDSILINSKWIKYEYPAKSKIDSLKFYSNKSCIRGKAADYSGENIGKPETASWEIVKNVQCHSDTNSCFIEISIVTKTKSGRLGYSLYLAAQYGKIKLFDGQINGSSFIIEK